MTMSMKKYKVFYTLKTVAVVEGESFVLPSYKEVFETDPCVNRTPSLKLPELKIKSEF